MTYNETNEPVFSPHHPVDAYLTPQRMEQLQHGLIEQVQERTGDQPGVYAVWLEASNPYANIVRTFEAELFPEIPELMADYESSCKFLAMVDTELETPRMVHAFRISLTHRLQDQGEKDGHTGIALLDDLLNSGQGLTLDEVVDYYRKQGRDIYNAFSVESNFRIGQKVKKDGLRVTDLGYLELFNFAMRNQTPVIFAHLNRPAVVSLGNLGVEHEPIAGREDLRTPSLTKDGKIVFDDKYHPVAIPNTQHNLAVFSELASLSVLSLEFK